MVKLATASMIFTIWYDFRRKHETDIVEPTNTCHILLKLKPIAISLEVGSAEVPASSCATLVLKPHSAAALAFARATLVAMPVHTRCGDGHGPDHMRSKKFSPDSWMAAPKMMQADPTLLYMCN